MNMAFNPLPASRAADMQVDLIIAARLAMSERGDVDGYFDLGIAFSSGGNGIPVDLVEAHKWFNIAAARGHEQAARCRADLADEMSAREVAEAQRRAREWLTLSQRRAA